MLNNIMLGQYFPGDSLLHRLDARVKLVLLLLMLIEVFVFSSGTAYGILAAVTAVLIMISGVPVRLVLRSLKPLCWIVIFTFVIHLFSHPGHELARIWYFAVTQEGVEQGALISLRLLLLILLSTLLTFTTSPLQLTDALESLLAPFKKFGLPAHELAMMMTIALRFIPTLLSEADKIMKAQQSRGADFTTGSILKRLKNMVPILVPLFLSAFRRADELALAMEARCYRGGQGRTRMKELRIRRVDYMAMAAFAVISAMMGVSLYI